VQVRVRPKFGFGFGYGAVNDLTYCFGLVSATAKVHCHKFGFGRNITPKRRNCKIGANCNTGSLAVRYWLHGGQGMLVQTTRNLIALCPILLPRLTACLALSSVIPGTLCQWSGSTASVRTLHLLLLLVGSQFRFRLRLQP